jgi:hypothetical protein
MYVRYAALGVPCDMKRYGELMFKTEDDCLHNCSRRGKIKFAPLRPYSEVVNSSRPRTTQQALSNWYPLCSNITRFVRRQSKLIFLDFKLPPPCDCCILSFGWFPVSQTPVNHPKQHMESPKTTQGITQNNTGNHQNNTGNHPKTTPGIT